MTSRNTKENQIGAGQHSRRGIPTTSSLRRSRGRALPSATLLIGFIFLISGTSAVDYSKSKAVVSEEVVQIRKQRQQEEAKQRELQEKAANQRRQEAVKQHQQEEKAARQREQEKEVIEKAEQRRYLKEAAEQLRRYREEAEQKRRDVIEKARLKKRSKDIRLGKQAWQRVLVERRETAQREQEAQQRREQEKQRKQKVKARKQIEKNKRKQRQREQKALRKEHERQRHQEAVANGTAPPPSGFKKACNLFKLIGFLSKRKDEDDGMTCTYGGILG